MEITKRQKRIFHFFETVRGYSTFGTLLDAATSAYPNTTADAALELFYKDETKRQQALANKLAADYVERNSDDVDAVLAPQWQQV